MAKQTFTTGQVLTAAQVNALQGNDYNQTVSTKTASYILVAADKGTRIVMNSTSATTITVNTGLFDAGDTLYIHNTNSGVCTITAGTATVATSGSLVLAQNQGGVLYFTSASASIFFQYATPASGDIEGVTAGTGISGGGTSGTVTITNSMATEITAAGDIIVGTGSGTFDNLPIGTTGQILTADTTVSPYKVKWAAPSGGSSTFAGCLAYRVTSATVAGSTTTAITLTAEQYDTDGYHNNSTNTSRLTIPSGKAGYYQINANIETATTTSANSLGIFINGTRYVGHDYTGNSGNESVCLSIIAYLAVSDYVEMRFYNGSGTALNVYGSADTVDQTTSLSIGYLGA